MSHSSRLGGSFPYLRLLDLAILTRWLKSLFLEWTHEAGHPGVLTSNSGCMLSPSHVILGVCRACEPLLWMTCIPPASRYFISPTRDNTMLKGASASNRVSDDCEQLLALRPLPWTPWMLLPYRVFSCHHCSPDGGILVVAGREKKLVNLRKALPSNFSCLLDTEA